MSKNKRLLSEEQQFARASNSLRPTDWVREIPTTLQGQAPDGSRQDKRRKYSFGSFDGGREGGSKWACVVVLGPGPVEFGPAEEGMDPDGMQCWIAFGRLKWMGISGDADLAALLVAVASTGRASVQ
ncbi:hypothetical protein AXG93_154s1530 [Marchantia polymorpha subsp. ruderalis]|uniref:Uncharacterized protein n=1 Tax=Marchantia polymorpha subsp. ruderalis TaxID=1480154 RepID=A0A176VIB4_MARPO|nr:hypothetical protein AXG93_154s1530 [Marchantia polymorpha subsp. ruderalis]